MENYKKINIQNSGAYKLWATLMVLLTLGLLLMGNQACASYIATIDGQQTLLEESPGNIQSDYLDIVGDTSNSSYENPWTAKGNAFRIDTGRTLVEQEFYLDFRTAQTLSFYVYESPVEFGTYNQIHKNSYAVTGHGEDWYSSGLINVSLDVGKYYILALSWNGSLKYFYDTGDSQAVSFGSQVHGYATGYDPLGPAISSTVNDVAIYHQRLSTVPEPCTIALLGLGGLALIRRKRR
ncbi:MAG: PEP-CTERM sorting domain-containing protein [Sedimentisphaerales bacterium]|nr:PEP-CTERM sorting domain-containing protein [Sedimentisphaerales bacterium]